MPSAANGKTEKPASAEASDNSPIRQIMTIIDHKIRNLEKRKSKLTSYRDLQKAGKELNADQKVAVAKYDEVAQTLEFARDLSKQITGIAASAERDLKKQAKKEAWVRYAAETSKIREVLLIFDCLNLMGAPEVREDFLNGSNGAAKLTENDLKILDDLYPEVNPKHEVNEEGQPGFHGQVTKAAEHLYAIADGKPKEVLGTTYTHIKNIISAVHECGYFDKGPETHEVEECPVPVEPEIVEEPQIQQMPQEMNMYPQQPANLPVPPAPAVVPPPAYPLRAMPPITLQEVEHAYFAQQYPQPRPISEVIGSQNFFFLQESEIDSPVATPQPPMVNQQSPQGPIPTQTFTNQHFVQIAGVRHPAEGMGVPQAHFAPPPEHGSYPVAMAPPPMGHVPVPMPQHVPHPMPQHLPPEAPATPPAPAASPPAEENDDWAEAEAPEKEADDAKAQPSNDGNRFRRFRNGGSRGGGRGPSNGFRGRSYPNRQSGEGYHGRQGNDNFQGRSNKDGYNRQYYSGYQNRNKDNYQGRNNNDNYYGNGDAGNGNQQNESAGTRDRYSNNNSNDGGYQGGFKSRGRGGPRGARGASRGNRTHYSRENDHAE